MDKPKSATLRARSPLVHRRMFSGWREGRREGGRRREKGKEGRRKGGREGRRERGKEGERERGREGKRERGKEGEGGEQMSQSCLVMHGMQGMGSKREGLVDKSN